MAIAAPIITEKGLASKPGSKGRPRKLHWKDEFLMYCCFHHADMTNRKIQALMDVSSGVVSNAIRSYADYLDIFFALAFPNPTRDEIQRNYPSSFIETFCHAMIVMIIDCTRPGGRCKTPAPTYHTLFSGLSIISLPVQNLLLGVLLLGSFLIHGVLMASHHPLLIQML